MDHKYVGDWWPYRNWKGEAVWTGVCPPGFCMSALRKEYNRQRALRRAPPALSQK